ncbi:MAG: hypothetical protein KC503_16620, partial [Myxococcales bacterium]|nr:hypothetical protein [Myxococcales bacterium]
MSILLLAPARARAADPPPPPAAASKPTSAAKASEPDALPGERAFNSCVKVPSGRRVKVTLRPQSSLGDLVGWISAMTCKRFIVPQSLAAQRVTLLAPTAIGAREAYRAFVSALSVIGLTVVASGRLLKVVPANWAVRSALPVYRHRQRGRVPHGDQMVTQILRVKQAQVGALGALLGRLKGPAGDVSTWQASNTLIITDSAANVRRMVTIVEALDEPLPGARIEVITLRYADPSETVRLLSSIFSGAGGAVVASRG